MTAMHPVSVTSSFYIPSRGFLGTDTKKGRVAVTKRGLDNRAGNKNGRIREKNGAAKVKNLEGDYPVLGELFGPEQTLTSIKHKYKVESLDEVLKAARKDAKGR
jgi:hypothetical protein